MAQALSGQAPLAQEASGIDDGDDRALARGGETTVSLSWPVCR